MFLCLCSYAFLSLTDIEEKSVSVSSRKLSRLWIPLRDDRWKESFFPGKRLVQWEDVSLSDFERLMTASVHVRSSDSLRFLDLLRCLKNLFSLLILLLIPETYVQSNRGETFVLSWAAVIIIILSPTNIMTFLVRLQLQSLSSLHWFPYREYFLKRKYLPMPVSCRKIFFDEIYWRRMDAVLCFRRTRTERIIWWGWWRVICKENKSTFVSLQHLQST